MTSAMLPVPFWAPLVNPAPGGLYSVTTWSDAGDGEPLRWLPSGVEVRSRNYGGEDAFGVWGPDWDAAAADLGPDDVKVGVRPEDLDPFTAVTVWASDTGNLTGWSQDEVKTRTQQVMRLREQIAVEREFAARMLTDAGTPDTSADIVGAVGHLEGLLSVTNVSGFIHASATWAASAAQALLIVRSGSTLKTPLGHTWVFGGGYVDGLGDKLVATSQPFGWRGLVEMRSAMKVEFNQFAAIAERSVLVGVEALVGAVNITG